MITFDLRCHAGHVFEGWFRSSADFTAQAAGGQIPCAVCGNTMVEKAVMAPNIGRKGNQALPPVPAPLGGDGYAPNLPAVATNVLAGLPDMPPEMLAVAAAIAKAQAESLPKSTWVGGDFAKQARAMHRGDQDAALIHGQTTPAEAEALVDEGVPIMPLLVPVVPPKLQN
jgi:hypothetical protein